MYPIPIMCKAGPVLTAGSVGNTGRMAKGREHSRKLPKLGNNMTMSENGCRTEF